MQLEKHYCIFVVASRTHMPCRFYPLILMNEEEQVAMVVQRFKDLKGNYMIYVCSTFINYIAVIIYIYHKTPVEPFLICNSIFFSTFLFVSGGLLYTLMAILYSPF